MVAAAAVIASLTLVVVVAVLAQPAPDPAPAPVDSEQLRAAVTSEALTAHLNALQQIADTNGGNRAAGTAGYAASVDYVAETLERAGYRVERQRFGYDKPEFTTATLLRTAPGRTEYAALRDHRPLAYSGTGSVTAAVVPVDVNLDGDRSTTSACEATDFTGFPRGTIALVQRGTCQFATKVGHAVAAGASAVLVFNQGDDQDRTGLFSGSLGSQVDIPVMATTFALGAEWAAQPGTRLTVTVDASVTRVATENLLADTAGESGQTIVLGAHLDGVADGPGINDNATGVAAVLETAVQFAALGVDPHHRVRFAFWGGEEDGLHGSEHYVAQLDQAARGATVLYLNLDMIGSPNPVPSVYGGQGWPDGSAAVRSVLTEFLRSQGVTPEAVSFPSSDHASFAAAGIAVGGLFTGADEGADPCYHAPCDRLDTIDREVLGLMADAAAHATLTFAQAPD